jgi:hypothetical protein
VEETADSAVVSISEDSGIEDPESEELQDARERTIAPDKTIAKNFFMNNSIACITWIL